MGGDFGPPNLVAGAVMALREYPHITKLFLVGDTAKIEAELNLEPNQHLRNAAKIAVEQVNNGTD